MIKKVLIAAALMAASPALVSAQDIFLSFSDTAVVSTSNLTEGDSGTAYIFSAPDFGFDAIDLNFASSDLSVLSLTGGQGFNPTFGAVGGLRFDSSDVSIDALTGDGNLFAVNVSENGVNPALGPLFDPGFVAGVGVLLAEIDFDVVGGGSASVGFSLGEQGALLLPDIELDPDFGVAPATLTAEAAEVGEGEDIPEPSSLALLLMGAAGLVARRKRA